MPPSGAGKRKRGDRSYSGDNYSRPSPHRPENLSLAQQNQSQSPSNARNYQDYRNRGGRRSSRGGRGGFMNSSPHNSTEAVQPAVNSSPQNPPTIMPPATMTAPQEPDIEPPPNPLPDPQPYNSTYLSDETCEEWDETGYKTALTQATTFIRDPESMEFRILVEELVHAVVFGRIAPTSAGDLIRETLEFVVEQEVGTTQEDIYDAVLGSLSIFHDKGVTMPLSQIAAFLTFADIPQDLLRNELDAGLLEKLDLLRSTFGRMGIRKQTNVLYRQANFNLMREESEGFAKLMTELFTTSSNEPPSGEVVEETVEKVKAMIGAFDLDVGRSLDVVLDVFGAVLVKQFRFFVKFLRTSPWWPRQHQTPAVYTILNGLPLWALPGESSWRLTEEQRLLVAKQIQERDAIFWPQAKQQGLRAFYGIYYDEKSAADIQSLSNATDDDFTVAWIKETGTRPPRGNRDAAQLLGFKLRFYSSNPARDENEVLPDNLIYLSALLIKIGFISLKDLYPHIWRSDEDMEVLKTQKLKEKAGRERAARPGAGVRNALLTAGALADDTISIPPRLREGNTRAGTPAKEAEAEKPGLKETSELADQKVLLLKSLLAIGALPEALFILGKFPWLLDLYPELPEYIHRILHHALSDVYSSLQPLENRPSLHIARPLYETDIPGLPKGQAKVVEPPERKGLRWALLDRNDSLDGTDYRFYWDEWNDNIPICQSVDDVFILCSTILPLVGVKIGQDPTLVLKFARIGKASLKQDTSEANRARWLDLVKRTLLPSLSLTKSNAGVVNEVFELCSNYSVNTRYLLYLEWSSGRTSRNPDIKSAFDQAKAETKDILKRISKTNIRPMARALAKVAYANPHIVITTALAQIEAYDSIADVFVEGARYFTDLGYDVLTWAMISSMARAGRSRTQEGGMFASRWLSALSQFAGKIYRRYSMMRPGPVLQYIAEQLDQGNSTDLKMLEQIVVSMAGISNDTSYNDAQLQAMGGGPLLQAQTILQLLDRRHDSAIKITSKRLARALQDHGLAGKFLLSMAQQRQACVFEEGDVPLKAIGNTYDEIHRILVQYLDLLRTNLSIDEFRHAVPDVVELLIDYEIRPEIAFSISRPLIAQSITEHDRESLASRKPEEAGSKDPGADIEMSDQVNASLDEEEEDGEAIEMESVTQDAATPTEIEINGTDLELAANEKTAVSPNFPTDDSWHPVLRPIIDAVEPTLPEEIVDVVGTGFYVTFWQLALYDITIPGKSYEDELSRQNKKIASITNDRSDVSLSGTRKREAEKKAIGELVDKLLAENKQHLKAFAESKARLQREKDVWFLGKNRVYEQLNIALMEHCFLPRMLTSPLDAHFCFKFIKFLHGVGTPNFRSLGFYDLLFRAARITALIFMCTSKEADNLGRFLNEVLKDFARWHASRTVYEREAWGMRKNLPGFAMKVEAGKPVALLDYESFRRILYKWHGQFYSALQKCILSPEYMHVRNAISVLRAVSTIFPTINFHGVGLQKAVDKLRESDKEDLKVASQALLGALHKREKMWVIPQAFRQGQDKNEDVNTAAQTNVDTIDTKVEPSKAPVRPEENQDHKINLGKPEKDATLSSDIKKEDIRGPSRNLKDETRHERDRSSSRPARNEGSSTPRTNAETPVPERRERDMRTPRSETTKAHGLPRRVSPPPSRHQLPLTLPTRPDSSDPRNGHRDSPRLQSRPAAVTEQSRPPVENRANFPRDTKSSHRNPDQPHYEDYDRHARRPDRPSGTPYPPREERDYIRERESERNYGGEKQRPSERDRPVERDRPTERPPPTPRDREMKERSNKYPATPRLPEDSHTTRPIPNVPRPVSPSLESMSINPERAALIDPPAKRDSNLSVRGQNQEAPARPSGPPSPKRTDDRRNQHRGERPPFEQRQEMPHSRPGPQPPQASSAGPTHLRGPGGQFGKEPRSSHNYPPVDMQQGRLEQDSSHRPPPRGERPSDADVPSGPRGRPPGSTPRGRGAPPNANTQSPSLSFPDRPTPTGPASRHARTNSHQEPATPTQPPIDNAGVHPSRLQQIEASPTEGSKPPLPPPQLVPSQAPPPAGPRGSAPMNAPSGPSPTARGPPTGGHMGEASVRGGRSNRHPLAAVNSTLSQAGQPTSIRGRGGMRQNSNNFTPHQSAQSGHGHGSGPPTDFMPAQQDLFGAQNPNGVPVAPRPQMARPDGQPDRRRDDEERDASRRPHRRHEDGRDRESHRNERDQREGKEDREPSRRDDRPSRRPDQPQGEERRDYRSGPREEMPPRKHGREEGAPYMGGGGRGARNGNESKRPRRNP